MRVRIIEADNSSLPKIEGELISEEEIQTIASEEIDFSQAPTVVEE